MELKIRKAQITDLDKISAIEAECFPPEEAASKEKYTWRLANYPDYFIVGEAEGEIVGVVCMIPMATPSSTMTSLKWKRYPWEQCARCYLS